MWPSPSGSLLVVRLSASPACSSSLAMGWATLESVSVVWRLTPQALLTKAEQSRPVADVPPQTYGMFRSFSAEARISERAMGCGPPAIMAAWYVCDALVVRGRGTG